MTVAAAVTLTTYVLAGTGLGPFATVWPYEQAADVGVQLNTGGPVVVLGGADFTLTPLDPLNTGGQVTLNPALLPVGGWTAGSRVTLIRATSGTQSAALGEAIGFSPKAMEDALDHLARQVQDVRALSASMILYPPGDPASVLPGAAARAGKVLGFDANGALAMLQATGGATIDLANVNPAFVTTTSLSRPGAAAPTPGAVAAVGAKWEDSTATVEGVSGYWAAPHPVYARWAFNKEWTSANTGAAASGSPATTLLTVAKNSGTNLDSVAQLTIAIGAANGSSNFCQNLIATDNGVATGQTIRCAEFDHEASAGKSAVGFGLAMNKFGDPATCSAIYIQRFGTASWSNGIVIGGCTNGLAADSFGLVMNALINTNSSISYASDAIIVGQGHRIQLAGTAGTPAALSNAGDFFKFIKGVNAFTFRDPTDTTSSFSIDGGGFAAGSGTIAAGWIANIGHSSSTEGGNIAQWQNLLGVQSVGIFNASGAAGNAATSAMRVRASVTTSRSISAGGTINASGADYAEYERKAPGCGAVAKGQIVGFDAEGRITDRFDDAMSFAVKSTAPNLVGGDDWHAHLGDPPAHPAYPPAVYAGAPDPGDVDLDMPSDEAVELARGVVWHGTDHRAAVRAQRTLDMRAAWDKRQADLAAHAADRAAFLKAEEQREADWAAGPLAAYKAAVSAFEAGLDAARAGVDRIAYCGKVPVNVTGAAPGQYVVAVRAEGGAIAGQLVDAAAITLVEYQGAVGRVRRVLDDGRAEIVVKPI